MWTRKDLKTKAKKAFSANYWKCVLVALILSIVLGAVSAPSIGPTFTFEGGVPIIGYNGGYKEDKHKDDYVPGDDFRDDDRDDDKDDADDDKDYATVSDADIDESFSFSDGDGNTVNISLGKDGSSVNVSSEGDENASFSFDGKEGHFKAESGEEDSFSVDGDTVVINGEKLTGEDGVIMSTLKEHRGELIFAGVVFAIIFCVIFLVAMVIAFVIDAFLLNPIELGGNKFFLKNTDEPAKFSNVLFAFDHEYLNIVKTLFLRDLFITLWSFLFVIPGIIKSYEYRMIPYILAENPGMDRKEAFKLSREMMTGNKWRAFVLDLSFIGWELLSVLTCGILSIFYVNPYRYATNAELYKAIRGDRDFSAAEAVPAFADGAAVNPAANNVVATAAANATANTAVNNVAATAADTVNTAVNNAAPTAADTANTAAGTVSDAADAVNDTATDAANDNNENNQ